MAKQSLDFVTSGTYQRDVVLEGGWTWAAGTEHEIAMVATCIAGSASIDTMYSWIRAKIYLLSTAAGEPAIFEWALIKCQSGDGLQDLNDDAAMEKLQKESRVFGRDVIANGALGGSYKPIKFELYQVKLNVGEELRLVIRPYIATAGATVGAYGLIEWRQVGA